MLSLCAVISGAEDVEDVEDVENYGREKEDFLKTFLSLPNVVSPHMILSAECLDIWIRQNFRDSIQMVCRNFRFLCSLSQRRTVK